MRIATTSNEIRQILYTYTHKQIFIQKRKKSQPGEQLSKQKNKETQNERHLQLSKTNDKKEKRETNKTKKILRITAKYVRTLRFCIAFTILERIS